MSEKLDKFFIDFLNKPFFTIPSFFLLFVLLAFQDGAVRFVSLVSYYVFQFYLKKKLLEKLGYGRDK